MEGEVLKYGWLIVLTLGQIIYIWMRMMKDRNHKKKEEAPPNPVEPENPSHGERLMGLETDVENLRDDNEKDHKLMRESNDKDHGLIRKDIQKLFNLYNKGKK